MTTNCDMAFGCLLDLQQSDGGWAYSTNSSWTEPTCYSIMALRAAGGPEQAIGRACEWLARRQRRDGGWSPGSSVEKSTHVTSLAVLALSEMTGHEMKGYEDVADRGVEWLLGNTGAESSFWARVARFATGTTRSVTDPVGWPWFPGAAAWVIPTALAICALSRQSRGKHRGAIQTRIDEARQIPAEPQVSRSRLESWRPVPARRNTRVVSGDHGNRASGFGRHRAAGYRAFHPVRRAPCTRPEVERRGQLAASRAACDGTRSRAAIHTLSRLDGEPDCARNHHQSRGGGTQPVYRSCLTATTAVSFAEEICS